ncbi:MAG: hypothetical protein FWH25_03685 [Syntrophorhabdaceae bacterium]|nr:hypothetical protein [Syntrophorhabdaceae bacterium]
MNVSGAAHVQMIIGLAVQKSILEVEASVVSKLLENISVDLPQFRQVEAVSGVDEPVDPNIGTQLNIVV